jgi:hypothetical protein
MTHAVDQVKCPLCEGHSMLTKDEALRRFNSEEFKETITSYHPPPLRMNPVEEVQEDLDYVGPTGPQAHLAVAQKQEKARLRLAFGGRRSPKE